jgi:hypothetical protein
MRLSGMNRNPGSTTGTIRPPRAVCVVVAVIGGD